MAGGGRVATKRNEALAKCRAVAKADKAACRDDRQRNCKQDDKLGALAETRRAARLFFIHLKK